MRISKTATLVSLLVAQPFVIIASYCWVVAAQGTTSAMDREYLYLFGDAIYLYLGYPLTRLIFIFREYGHLQMNEDWWAIPLMNALFIMQWAIWGQCFVIVDKAGKWLSARRGGGVQRSTPYVSKGNGGVRQPYSSQWTMPNKAMQPTATRELVIDEEAGGG